jgi:hypothetical protein
MTGTSFIPALIVTMVVRKTQQLIDTFKNTGTTNFATAKTPAELNVRRSVLFKRNIC